MPPILPPVRILLAHNSYQVRGGEDAVFEDEARLLAEHGHQVHRLHRHNDEVNGQPPWRTAAEAIWSARSVRELEGLIDRLRPEVMHVHNTFPLLSPAILGAAARRGVAVVATLHNFRLGCLEAAFSRHGRTCTDCLGHLPWRGVLRGCYRNSRAQSAVLAASTVLHRTIGSWPEHVHRFIVLNQAALSTYQAIGLPRDRMVVKPNFAWSERNDSPAAPTATARQGGLFVGRLTAEKGAVVLADALRHVPELPFTVVGEGQAASAFQGTQARLTGAVGMDEVRQRMRAARFLVIPSIAAEQFPRVVAEAFACGLPILASAITPLNELAGDGQRGMLFPAGDTSALAERLTWAARNPESLADMGSRAKAYHQAALSPEAAHRSLMDIYQQAIAQVAQR